MINSISGSAIETDDTQEEPTSDVSEEPLQEQESLVDLDDDDLFDSFDELRRLKVKLDAVKRHEAGLVMEINKMSSSLDDARSEIAQLQTGILSIISEVAKSIK